MITTKSMIDWCTAAAPTLTFFPRHASPVPDKPDRLIMVTRTAGAGETMDGLFDRPGFSFRIRGTAHDPDTAEVDALLLDMTIRTASIPALIGDSWVTSIIRLGGIGPLPGTPDAGHRTEWVATYIVEASTNI